VAVRRAVLEGGRLPRDALARRPVQAVGAERRRRSAGARRSSRTRGAVADRPIARAGPAPTGRCRHEAAVADASARHAAAIAVAGQRRRAAGINAASATAGRPGGPGRCRHEAAIPAGRTVVAVPSKARVHAVPLPAWRLHAAAIAAASARHAAAAGAGTTIRHEAAAVGQRRGAA
jgi:hypothetical protein